MKHKEFQLLTNNDIELITKYSKLTNYSECNHNLSGYFIWQQPYPIYFYQEENFILLIGLYERELYLYMPLCTQEYFSIALIKAKDIFHQNKVKLILSAYSYEEALLAKKTLPSLNIKEIEESYDYIYLVDKLITFSGKKLQKKRNHLNYFYNTYHNAYSYEKINHTNINECISLLDIWEDSTITTDKNNEYDAIINTFKLWDKLPLKGGLIRINNVVQAFSIGSMLNNDMCQIHFEKANEKIRGLYQAICKELLIHEFKNVTYVNREDDMGIENLRKSKEAYNPIKLIRKYKLWED
ncbi:MAG: phosphatidylglycerol lysyltransferase domain-containing protein [Erysipelotrichaceae bacterium]